jgi:hypothetical protein
MRGNLAKYCALVFGAIALIASAKAETPALRPLGIGLEDIDYPYPVHLFDLTLEGNDGVDGFELCFLFRQN